MIQQLFKEGKSFSVFPFRIIYLETEDAGSNLLAAFSVSTRNFKRAIDRNRIKRLMRESYRLQKTTLQLEVEENHKNIALFFIFTGKELPDYSLVFEKIGKALLQLQKIIQQEL